MLVMAEVRAVVRRRAAIAGCGSCRELQREQKQEGQRDEATHDGHYDRACAGICPLASDGSYSPSVSSVRGRRRCCRQPQTELWVGLRILASQVPTTLCDGRTGSPPRPTPGSAIGGGFNLSMQHTTRCLSERGVADGQKTADPVHRHAKSAYVGALVQAAIHALDAAA